MSNQNFWPAQANNASWHHLLCTLDILDLMQFAQSNGFRLKPELNPYRLKPELNLCWVKSDGLNSGCAYYYIRTENNQRTEKNHTIGTEQNHNQKWNRNRNNLKTKTLHCLKPSTSRRQKPRRKKAWELRGAVRRLIESDHAGAHEALFQWKVSSMRILFFTTVNFESALQIWSCCSIVCSYVFRHFV